MLPMARAMPMRAKVGRLSFSMAAAGRLLRMPVRSGLGRALMAVMGCWWSWYSAG